MCIHIHTCIYIYIYMHKRADIDAYIMHIEIGACMGVYIYISYAHHQAYV